MLSTLSKAVTKLSPAHPGNVFKPAADDTAAPDALALTEAALDAASKEFNESLTGKKRPPPTNWGGSLAGGDSDNDNDDDDDDSDDSDDKSSTKEDTPMQDAQSVLPDDDIEGEGPGASIDDGHIVVVPDEETTTDVPEPRFKASKTGMFKDVSSDTLSTLHAGTRVPSNKKGLSANVAASVVRFEITRKAGTLWTPLSGSVHALNLPQNAEIFVSHAKALYLDAEGTYTKEDFDGLVKLLTTYRQEVANVCDKNNATTSAFDLFETKAAYESAKDTHACATDQMHASHALLAAAIHENLTALPLDVLPQKSKTEKPMSKLAAAEAALAKSLKRIDALEARERGDDAHVDVTKRKAPRKTAAHIGIELTDSQDAKQVAKAKTNSKRKTPDTDDTAPTHAKKATPTPKGKGKAPARKPLSDEEKAKRAAKAKATKAANKATKKAAKKAAAARSSSEEEEEQDACDDSV